MNQTVEEKIAVGLHVSKSNSMGYTFRDTITANCHLPSTLSTQFSSSKNITKKIYYPKTVFFAPPPPRLSLISSSQ
jgi:hypothetical protein